MSIPTEKTTSSKPSEDTPKASKSRSKGIAARQEGGTTHILTPTELKAVEALSKALVSQMGAKLELENARQEIGRVTGEIAKLTYARGNIVWAEARKQAGFPAAPTLTAPSRR